jgi:hypothetical protein
MVIPTKKGGLMAKVTREIFDALKEGVAIWSGYLIEDLKDMGFSIEELGGFESLFTEDVTLQGTLNPTGAILSSGYLKELPALSRRLAAIKEKAQGTLEVTMTSTEDYKTLINATLDDSLASKDLTDEIQSIVDDLIAAIERDFSSEVSCWSDVDCWSHAELAQAASSRG